MAQHILCSRYVIFDIDADNDMACITSSHPLPGLVSGDDCYYIRLDVERGRALYSTYLQRGYKLLPSS